MLDLRSQPSRGGWCVERWFRWQISWILRKILFGSIDHRHAWFLTTNGRRWKGIFALIHCSNDSNSLIRSFHPTADEQVSNAVRHWSDWKYLFADVEVIRSRRCSADSSLVWVLAMSHPRIYLKNTDSFFPEHVQETDRPVRFLGISTNRPSVVVVVAVVICEEKKPSVYVWSQQSSV